MVVGNCCSGGFDCRRRRIFFLKNFDLNKYKSYAAKIVYEHTGRKLDVKGDASLGISLIPTLIINDVTLSNPSWAKNPQMAEIGSLELKFSLLPLFKNRLWWIKRF